MLERFIKASKVSKKIHLRNLKQIRKSRLKLRKFSKRPGCFIVSDGHVKCMDCGQIRGLNFVCCDKCFANNSIKLGQINGVMISDGPVPKNRFKTPIQNGKFLSLKEFKNRLAAGDRFMDLHGNILSN